MEYFPNSDLKPLCVIQKQQQKRDLFAWTDVGERMHSLIVVAVDSHTGILHKTSIHIQKHSVYVTGRKPLPANP